MNREDRIAESQEGHDRRGLSPDHIIGVRKRDVDWLVAVARRARVSVDLFTREGPVRPEDGADSIQNLDIILNKI